MMFPTPDDEPRPTERELIDASMFKFSQITRENFTRGTALFILANLDKLALKEKEVIVKMAAEMCHSWLGLEERSKWTRDDWLHHTGTEGPWS